MANNKKVTLKVEADSKNAQTGINKVTSELNKLAKSVKSSPLAKFSLSVGAVGVAFKTLTSAVKAAGDAVKDVTDAYKQQAKAEIQLETAAKNNPFLNSRNVSNLKAFASEMQSISTVGDEQLLPLMAELASAGRTQEEIQSIIKASLDASASGVISLDSAVTALNASYSGTTGTLGKLLPQVKNLSKEELAQGKAVEVVAKAYEGMAQEVAEATGTSEQLANAVGDLKEELGAPFEKALSPVRKFFTEVITGWANALKAKREYEDAKAAVENGTENDSQRATYIEGVKKEVEELQNLRDKTLELYQLQNLGISRMSKEQKSRYMDLKIELDSYIQKFLWTYETEEDAYKQATLSYKAQVEERRKELEALEEEQKEALELAEKEAEANANAQASADAMAKRDELRQAYKDAIDQKKKEIELRRLAGEEITKEEEAQQLYNVAIGQYVKMYSDPAFDRSKTKTGMWAGEEEQRAEIATWAQIVASANDLKEALEEIDKLSNIDDLEALKATLEELDAEMTKLEEDATEDQLELWEAYAKEREEIAEKIAEIEAQKAKEAADKIKETLKESLMSLANTIGEITQLISDNAKVTQENETNEAKKQYEEGLISYEEYCDKKEEIDKKAALENYRAQMANWSMSLATAISNIAQGVTKAIAEGGILGIIQGAAVSAAGATQIATLVANKPIRPSFEYGGIVPGTSYHGDNVTAQVNSKEMVLTQQQQLALWKVANSKGASGGIEQNIIIENTIADKANVATEASAGKIRILIRDVVAQEMGKGTFDAEINNANSRASGVRYL